MAAPSTRAWRSCKSQEETLSKGTCRDSVLEGRRKVAEELDSYFEDACKLADRAEDLRRRYPDEWIAFFQGRVRCHARSFEELLGMLDELENRGLDRTRVHILLATGSTPIAID